MSTMPSPDPDSSATPDPFDLPSASLPTELPPNGPEIGPPLTNSLPDSPELPEPDEGGEEGDFPEPPELDVPP